MIASFYGLYRDTAQRHELVILSQGTYRVITVIIIMRSVIFVLFRASSRRIGALEMSISVIILIIDQTTASRACQ